MALIMGGLLWWKLAAGKSADAAAAAAPAPIATAPALNEAPPPPPPPAPEAKPAADRASAPKSTGAMALGGCAGACTGSATAELTSALRVKAGAARSCYERALRQNAMLQGRMTVGLRVGATGRVCSASIVSNSLGDPGVASCVAGLMRSGSLPAPTGGCVDVQVPMNFVGKT